MTLLLEADYEYDAFGNRTERIVDADGAGGGAAVTTKFAIDQWNPAKARPIGTENADVWGDAVGGGSLTTRYLRGDVVDQLLARIDGSTARWYVHDHLGSIRKVLDNSGVVKDAITYDAWGNILAETDANERGRYAWTSREIDVETALQYNRARYYDATTGRWISQDPLGFDAGDSNLFRYVNNRSPGTTDPSGMKPIEGEFTLKANTTSTAEKGKYTTKKGKVVESTNGEVVYRKFYNMQYDGPTDFNVKYQIVLKDDKSVDQSESTVTFDSLNYTRRRMDSQAGESVTKAAEQKLIEEGKSVYRVGEGILQAIYIFQPPVIISNQRFTTLPITITEVKLKKDCSVESFKFKSDTWYNPARSDLIDKGVFGEINLETGKSEFTSKYQFRDDAVIVTWVTVSRHPFDGQGFEGLH